MESASQSVQPMVLRLEPEPAADLQPAPWRMSLGRSLLIALAAGGAVALVPMAIWGIFESGPSARELAERRQWRALPGSPPPVAEATPATTTLAPKEERHGHAPAPAKIEPAAEAEPATGVLQPAPPEVTRERTDTARRARRTTRRRSGRIVDHASQALSELSTLALETPDLAPGNAAPKPDGAALDPETAIHPAAALEVRDLQRSQARSRGREDEPPSDTDELLRRTVERAEVAVASAGEEPTNEPSSGWSWGHAHAAGSHWAPAAGVEDAHGEPVGRAPSTPLEPGARAPLTRSAAPQGNAVAPTVGPGLDVGSRAEERDGLDRQLAQYAHSHSGLLRRCLQGPLDMPVRVDLQLRVLPSGQVADVQVSGQVSDARAPDCLRRILTRWRLSERSDEVTVVLPLRY